MADWAADDTGSNELEAEKAQEWGTRGTGARDVVSMEPVTKTISCPVILQLEIITTLTMITQGLVWSTTSSRFVTKFSNNRILPCAVV